MTSSLGFKVFIIASIAASPEAKRQTFALRFQ
jgi:hypothetical protein